MKRAVLSLFLVVGILSSPLSATAQTSAPNKGLLISPLRTYLKLDSGTKKAASFTIANRTDKNLTIDLSVQQFSVTDYTYDYRFHAPENDWVKLGVTQATLKPSESRVITYQVDIPPHTASGGHYYTLVASADLAQNGLKSTVRAASLLYVTINGTLIRTSELVHSSIARFSFGKQIAYTLDIRNTGNVHYFAYVAGKLHGPLMSNEANGTSHLLLPGVIRRVSGNIPTPLLPGIYQAEYGYVTDAGDTVSQKRLLLFIPPWSVAFTLLLVFGAIKLYRYRKRKAVAPQIASEPKD